MIGVLKGVRGSHPALLRTERCSVCAARGLARNLTVTVKNSVFLFVAAFFTSFTVSKHFVRIYCPYCDSWCND